MAAQFKDPEDLARYMEKHFKYAPDVALFNVPDYWQSPQEFDKRGRGDCEDYSYFEKYQLEKMGYRAFVLGIWENGKEPHTILIFHAGGLVGEKMGVFDLGELRWIKARSLEEIAAKIRPYWDYIGLMRKQGSGAIISRKFSDKKGRTPLSVGLEFAEQNKAKGE